MRRVMFLGQKQFGECAWDLLREREGAGYQVVALVSNASRDAVWWNSARIWETRGGRAFVDNAARNEEAILRAVRELGVDTLLCVQHAWVLSAQVLEAVGYNAINFHNARLPDYRGYNAVNHALLNGDPTFTCTGHWMADRVDAGDVACEAVFRVHPDETAVSLYAKCHHAGLRAFQAVLDRLEQMESLPRRPLAGEGTFYSRRSSEALRDATGCTPEEQALRARAFFFPPFEPAYVRADGRKVYLLPPSVRECGFDTSRTGTLQRMMDTVQVEYVQVG